ncbi:MAG: tetratricopeptide repeat protein, partial [Spirochaetes bacterium]|nr:tetratricopeptide repeat protein [Spirochaetota bacterium]
MKLKVIIPGLLLILIGVAFFVYYDLNIRPEREARELIVQGNLIAEREDKDSINQAINVYSQVVAKYPKSKLVSEAFFQIGKCYEKLGLYRLARLKYVYVAKNEPKNLSEDLKKELFVRMAHIKALRQYSEEAINQLYGLLNGSYNNEFRSRVYSELGHTYLKEGQYKNAQKMFEISMTEYCRNEDAIIGKASDYNRLGLYEDAYNMYDYFLKYYGAVSQYTADVKKAYKDQTYQTGLDLFRGGQYNKAIPFFDRILLNFPDDRYSENALYWIGECNYAMRLFDKAIGYFNRVLTNGYYHKDQDARMKKGYAFFIMKRFDLAAREFQIYLSNYPFGIHAQAAKNWNAMCTKELLYRIKTKKLPEAKKEEAVEEKAPPKKEEVKIEENKGEDIEKEDEEDEDLDLEDDSEDESDDSGEDEEIFGKEFQEIFGKKGKLENV